MSTTLTDSTAPPLPRKRWTIEEFDRLAREGFLREPGRIDLWDGDIITDRSGPELGRKRWTIEEFDRLMIAGFIREGSRTFLWDGEIITPMPEDPAHANACEILTGALIRRLPEDLWTTYSGRPVRLAGAFLPQPDFVVARGPRSSYRMSPPTGPNISLVIEVSNTTYYFDSGEYLRHYASAGIPLYWLVHIKARRVEVYSGPIAGGARFEQRTDYGLGETVPLILDAAHEYEGIAVEAILRDSLED